jgi:thiol-disulfide isomerase/thioredoxin
MKHFVFAVFLISLTAFAHAHDFVSKEYSAYSTQHGAAWRWKLTSMIPLPNACSSEDLRRVARQAQGYALEKCHRDGATDCLILDGRGSMTNADGGCMVSVVARGKISYEENERREALRSAKAAAEQKAREERQAQDAEQARLDREARQKLLDQKRYLAKTPISTMSELNALIEESLTHKIILNFVPDFECGPCRAMQGILEFRADMEPLKIINISVEPGSELADHFGITSVPTFIKVEVGFETGRSVGVSSPDDFRSFVRGNKK